MTDQVPVVPADGAVAAAVDRPAVAAVENNAQNANGKVVPAPQPAAPEPEVAVPVSDSGSGSRFRLFQTPNIGPMFLPRIDLKQTVQGAFMLFPNFMVIHLSGFKITTRPLEQNQEFAAKISVGRCLSVSCSSSTSKSILVVIPDPLQDGSTTMQSTLLYLSSKGST
ncbi:uncharacterized protein [Montipora capricornis]|uniref:uncharacterized protein n=1 Tax=Montipora capricornis TaxID=246305 RepID=UPI0035F21956